MGEKWGGAQEHPLSSVLGGPSLSLLQQKYPNVLSPGTGKDGHSSQIDPLTLENGGDRPNDDLFLEGHPYRPFAHPVLKLFLWRGGCGKGFPGIGGDILDK